MILNRIGQTCLNLLCGMAMLTSCVGENIEAQKVVSDAESLSASTRDFVEEDVPEETRSSLNYNESTKKLVFSWESGDKLLLCNKETALGGTDDVAYAAYTLKSTIDNNTALFSGGGFNLASGYDYYAFTPYDAALKGGSMQDLSDLELSYEGQRQSENNNSDHIGAYDYQTAMSYTADDGKLHFDFNHLSAVLRVKMKINDAEAKKRAYKTLTIYTADNYDFQMTRSINLLQDVASPSDYAPAFKERSDEADATVPHKITLELGNDGKGIVPDVDGILYMYLAIPGSSELYDNGSPRTVYAEVTPVEDGAPSYNISFLAKDYKGGTCYTIGREAVESGDATLQVYVERAWQTGYADVTRAGIGDPGFEDEYASPSNLQICVCVDGHPRLTKKVTDIAEGDWKVDGTKLQYTKPILLPLGNISRMENVRAYVAAWKDEPHDISTVNLGDAYDEELARSMTFSLTSSSNSDTRDANQLILKNLYSNPYVATDRNGLSTDMTNLNLIACLYHVACKVDLNWEASKDNRLVGYSVKNLLRSGYLFLPTENAPATSSVDSYTVNTSSLTKLYGRDSFFAIQQKRNGVFPLSLTWTTSPTGSSDDKSKKTTSKTVSLKTSEGNGQTSWFRINRKW